METVSNDGAMTRKWYSPIRGKGNKDHMEHHEMESNGRLGRQARDNLTWGGATEERRIGHVSLRYSGGRRIGRPGMSMREVDCTK